MVQHAYVGGASPMPLARPLPWRESGAPCLAILCQLPSNAFDKSVSAIFFYHPPGAPEVSKVLAFTGQNPKAQVHATSALKWRTARKHARGDWEGGAEWARTA
jgi:hypothetical protein